MFNLLMAYTGWGERSDVVAKDRVLEFTSERLVERFRPDKAQGLDTEAVRDLPVLLMQERSSEAGPARVARLTRVQLSGRTYHLDYVVDPDVPAIPYDVIESLGSELGIVDSFEWNRTHWAIKEADLFEVLLKHGIGKKAKPSGFEFTDERDPNLVAVMMPFGAEFKDIYAAIKAAAKAAGLKAQRADDIWDEDVVLQDVVNLICKARVVVCDLTGRNPNVFYEMGIAHSLGKDVVMITQHKDDVPFDVQARRYLRYLPNEQGLEKMTVGLQERLQKLAGL